MSLNLRVVGPAISNQTVQGEMLSGSDSSAMHGSFDLLPVCIAYYNSVLLLYSIHGINDVILHQEKITIPTYFDG